MSKDQGIRNIAPYHAWVNRSILLFIGIVWMWRGYSHLWLQDFSGAQMTRIMYAPTYHVYKWLDIESWLVHHQVVATIFDYGFLVLIIVGLIKPLHQWLLRFLFVFISLYAIAYPIHLTFSVHYFAPIWIMSVILLFNRPNMVNIIWEALRYYVCWVYGSAFVWKIIYGAIFDWNNGFKVMQQNMAQYLLLNQPGDMTPMYRWMYEHAYLLNLGQYLAFIIEAFFIVGFFTKKYDKWLLWCIPILHISLYIFVDTLFIESLIFCLVFMSISQWHSLSSIKTKYRPAL